MTKLLSTCAVAVTLWICAFGVMAETINVTDDRGKTLVLEKPAERIVALAPHIVENLYSAGAGDKLIGVVSYSDYPPEAQALPQVGSYMAINFEQIVAMKPDL